VILLKPPRAGSGNGSEMGAGFYMVNMAKGTMGGLAGNALKSGLLSLLLTGGIGTSGAVITGERIAAPDDAYSYVSPEWYTRRDMENGGVELFRAGSLSTFIPVIRMTLVDEDEAFDEYDEILEKINRERYVRIPRMRLINRKDIENSFGFDGWQLTYTEQVAGQGATSYTLVVFYCLLLLEDGLVLRLEGRSLFDNRTDFMLTCDMLTNSIDR
jgi:hypothetical protein